MSGVVPAEVLAAALSAQAATSVPASVTVAQWALESGWGAHMPAGSCNPFGIKARPGDPFVTVPTREFVKGRTETIMANFRKFASLDDAFAWHAELLSTAECYEPAMACLPDSSCFANALTGVYATDPNYGTTLIKIIGDNGLGQYDDAPAPVVVAAAAVPDDGSDAAPAAGT